MAVHNFFTWAGNAPETFFLITKGGPSGIFDKINFFACFVRNFLSNSLNIDKCSISKTNYVKKFVLSKIPKGPLSNKKKMFLGHYLPR